MGLIHLGLGTGDVVLLQLPNWAEFVYSYFALQKIGCIPVLLISGYRQLEVGHLGRLTEAKAWIVPDLYRKIDYLSFIGEVKKENPQLQYIISVRAQRQDSHFTTSLERTMEREWSDEDRRRLAARRPDPKTLPIFFLLEGQQGCPKEFPVFITITSAMRSMSHGQEKWAVMTSG